MTTYKARGVLVNIGDTQEFASGFTSRRFVADITDNPKYESPVQFTLKKAHCQDIEGYVAGDVVDITFTVDGRKWESPNGPRWFTDLTAWKIEHVGGENAAAGEQAQGESG